MPQVNLSTLSGPELRQMLDASRRRGEAKLTYQILQEMAARREAQPERTGVFRKLRPAEPRIIDIDLGDPMAPKDDVPPMPAWRPPTAELRVAEPPAPAPRPEPAGHKPRRGKAARATLADAMAAGVADLDDADLDVAAQPPPPEPRPRSVWDDEPPPAPDLPPPQASKVRRASGGLGRGLAAGFVVGAAAGVALGWGLGGQSDAPSPAVAPGVAAMEIAAATPPPTPTPAAAEPLAQAPAALSVELAPPEIAAAPPAAEPEAETASPEAAEPLKPAETPRLALARAAPVPSEACAAEPTPADRQICGDEELRRLQLELREAYAQALEAHEDRALLRQRQLAWRSARDPISDPVRLAQLYAERIRKLDAATAEARQQR